MEIMTEPLAETEKGTIAAEALPDVLRLLKGKNIVLIGPGISTHPSTSRFVLSLLPKIRIPTVIDADGLNILAGQQALFKSLPKISVLTPHPGEFARMLNISIKEVLENKLELVPRFAGTYGVYLVLKGYKTLISTPDGRVYINPTGNPGMATGGSGDVLSGMIASMMAQEKEVLDAVLAAVYLHGLSGDLGAHKIGERSLVAGDLIKYLPKALKKLEAG
jgi:NAD(P)H-hydrate epimerase